MNTCSRAEEKTTGCISSAIDGNEAVIGGTVSTPGTPVAGGTGGGSGGGAAIDPADLPRFLCKPGDDPTSPTACDPADPTGTAPITLSDIARFRPSSVQQAMEPAGWVVVGLPANIYAASATEIVPGQLLGRPAEVRFTPIGYHWDYGDGTSARLGTPGGTWSALGLREFDATPTSHVYTTAGTYTIRLTIAYRAEYRIDGGPFVPITGTVALPANELVIAAGSAKTVLVDHDCTRQPAGPGC